MNSSLIFGSGITGSGGALYSQSNVSVSSETSEEPVYVAPLDSGLDGASLYTATDVEAKLPELLQQHHRDYYKGTSFRFSIGWKQGYHYRNDEYITDFIAFNNTLLACKENHLATEEPVILYDDNDNIIGVDSEYWEVTLYGVKGAANIDYTTIISALGYIPADASTAYEKPDTGIPASDIADGVIPDVSNFITKSVDDLTNYYLKSETYTKDEVAALIGAIQQFHYEIYPPTSSITNPESNVLYLIGPTGTGTDKYEEYVYDPSKEPPFVKIGDTSIDLSNYVTTDALNTALANYTTTANLTTLLAGKQDKIDADHKLSYTLLTDTPTIPDAQIQSDWNQADDTKKDFIKNKPTIPTVTGKADKVSGAVNGNFAGLDSNGNLTDSGKKASDFATSTQGGKADTAYQKPSGGIPSSDMSEAVRASLGKADTALQSFTETDPTVPSWAKAQNPPTEIFWATYGTTTAAEIDAAVSAGKAAMCNYSGSVFIFCKATSSYIYFGCSYSNRIEFLQLRKSDSHWDFAGGGGFQYENQRVDDITGNESDTSKYPSTKAVADYVTSKAEVFVAEYGVTTYAEITAAVADGKICVAYRNNRIYHLDVSDFLESVWFISVVGGEVYRLRCTQQNNWSNDTVNLQHSSYRLSSWQSTPDNTHYPSEKLVKDSLDAIHQIPSGGTSGQVLSKVSGTDYDTEWFTPPSGSSDAVQYTPQTLTDAQKAQARVNIQTLHANFDETITPVTTGAETTQNKAQTLVGNENDTTKYPCTKAVADALGKWGVVSQTQTWTRAADGGYDYTMSDQVYGFIPKANIDLYEAAGVGAVFNENTGYFELNELTDISYEEIRRIYAKSIGGYTFTTNRNSQFALYSERTTVQLSNPGGYNTSINHTFQSSAIHIAYLVDCNNLGATLNTFFVASRLKKVIGILNALSWNDKAFGRCFSLESVTISGLRSNISFQDSQRLSLASVVYMVTNSTNTSAITITLHAVAYARCQADTTEYTYNGQTYTGILAYASAKNITIASA